MNMDNIFTVKRMAYTRHPGFGTERWLVLLESEKGEESVWEAMANTYAYEIEQTPEMLDFMKNGKDGEDFVRDGLTFTMQPPSENFKGDKKIMLPWPNLRPVGVTRTPARVRIRSVQPVANP